MSRADSVYTYAQLQKMQALKLKYKVNVAKQIIRKTFKSGGKIALAFSGGKDSAALWQRRCSIMMYYFKEDTMRIYISGPITGTTDYRERFQAAEDKLRANGYEVVNPAEVTASLPKSLTWEQYMGVAVCIMALCDSVYMLKGWQKSRGAKLEHKIMLGKGRKIFYEDGEQK